jgi:prophage tail gpP-like protein
VAITHTASLTLANGSTEIDVWDRYTVSLSMLRVGQPWTFSLWRSTTRNTTWELLNRRVQLFDRVTLAIDGHPQLTGCAESFERHADGHGECIAVLSGRDLAGVAQSWDADPTINLRGVTLEDALSALFTPLALTLTITPAAAAAEVQGARRPGARGARPPHPPEPPRPQAQPAPPQSHRHP